MRILITGSLGASGKVLMKNLKQNNSDDLLFYSDIKDFQAINYYKCDLTDEKQVYDLIKTTNPDQIYHLAGSFSNDFKIDFKCNLTSTKNIFDSILKINLKTKILIIGSSAEYGFVKEEENPIKENHELNPCSIYGLTKVFQTQLMKYYYTMYNLRVVMARPFNLIGEGFSEKLFIGNLYSQIEKYKNGEIEKIILGNLDNKRDYIEIEKAIEFYVMIMKSGKLGEIYNIGSGKSIKIRDLLNAILLENNLNFDSVEIKNFINSNKYDIKNIYADIEKIKC